MIGSNLYIQNGLNNILETYQSIIAFFYQKINQSQYSNSDLEKYQINYSLLLPASQYLNFLSENSVNAQVQAYINLCETLVDYITTTTNIQVNLYLENVQNILNTSISNLNGFAKSLLQAQYETLYYYTTPYDMSLSNVLFLNGISLDNYGVHIMLNSSFVDFNNILKGTLVLLSR